MTKPTLPKRESLYATRMAAGALLGQQLAGRIAVIVDGQVVYPWRVLAAAKVAEQQGAKHVVIATPVATQAAVERIDTRRYDFVCPSVVLTAEGHPSPYGDMTGDTPERLKSIMIAHQAA